MSSIENKIIIGQQHQVADRLRLIEAATAGRIKIEMTHKESLLQAVEIISKMEN